MFPSNSRQLHAGLESSIINAKKALIMVWPTLCLCLHFLLGLTDEVFFGMHTQATITEGLTHVCQICKLACTMACFMDRSGCPICLQCGHQLGFIFATDGSCGQHEPAWEANDDSANNDKPRRKKQKASSQEPDPSLPEGFTKQDVCTNSIP